MSVAVEVVLPSANARGAFSAMQERITEGLCVGGQLLTRLVRHDHDVRAVPIAELDHVVIAIVAAVIAIPPAPVNRPGDAGLAVALQRIDASVVIARIE